MSVASLRTGMLGGADVPGDVAPEVAFGEAEARIGVRDVVGGVLAKEQKGRSAAGVVDGDGRRRRLFAHPALSPPPCPAAPAPGPTSGPAPAPRPRRAGRPAPPAPTPPRPPRP